MEEKNKCITLLCSLLGSLDTLVVAIGSTTQPVLKFEHIVTSLLPKEMRRKSIENRSTDALLMRLDHSKDRINSTRGRSKYRGRCKSLRYSLKKLCWKSSKPGYFKKNYR